MEIKNKTIRETIAQVFKKQGHPVSEDESDNYLGFLKDNKEIPSNSYIKLYHLDKKVVLKEEYASKHYWIIKDHLKEMVSKNPDRKDLSVTAHDLKNLPKEAIEEMKTIWFTADLHQGHKGMAFGNWDGINRPKFETIEEHDDWLANTVINDWVKKKDRLYILGDLSLRPRKEAEKFIDRLNGQKTLILGNHDENIKNTDRFTEITQRKDFKWHRYGLNIHIVLDHYPLASWNRKIHGSWQLYGHVHGRLKNQGLSLDVGIDNTELPYGGHRPINLYEVCQFMIKRRGEIPNYEKRDLERDMFKERKA